MLRYCVLAFLVVSSLAAPTKPEKDDILVCSNNPPKNLPNYPTYTKRTSCRGRVCDYEPLEEEGQQPPQEYPEYPEDCEECKQIPTPRAGHRKGGRERVVYVMGPPPSDRYSDRYERPYRGPVYERPPPSYRPRPSFRPSEYEPMNHPPEYLADFPNSNHKNPEYLSEMIYNNNNDREDRELPLPPPPPPPQKTYKHYKKVSIAEPYPRQQEQGYYDEPSIREEEPPPSRGPVPKRPSLSPATSCPDGEELEYECDC